MNDIEIGPEGSPNRNQQIIDWVNIQAQIESERIRGTEPLATRPFTDHLLHVLRLIWRSFI